jgi:zinc protease
MNRLTRTLKFAFILSGFLVTAAPQALAQKDTMPEAPVIQPEKPLLDIKEVKTPSGLTVWLIEDHSLPIISVSFAFKDAGAKQDPPNLQGLARLLSNTLDEGAGEMTSRQFQKELQDNAIQLSYDVSRDHFFGSLKTLSRHKQKAFDLLEISIKAPRFDQEPVTRMINANQSRIRSSLSDPEWIAARLMNHMAFEGTAYAQNSGGTLSSLAKIKPSDLRTYHDQALAKSNLYIAVTGDITEEELGKRLDKIFGDLRKNAILLDFEGFDLQNRKNVWVYEYDISQTIIEIMQPGLARKDPDFNTAQVMNFILGSSGFGSRLTKSVREESGLTYGIYTALNTMEDFNGLSLGTSTRNETAGQLMDMIRQEWRNMIDTPVTEQEVRDARNYLIGSVPLSLTSTDRISGFLLDLQLDNLPADYLDQRVKALEAVTPEKVTTLASRLLDTDAMSIVMVGRPAGITADKKIEEIPDVH